jgi:hypothetical protein
VSNSIASKGQQVHSDIMQIPHIKLLLVTDPYLVVFSLYLTLLILCVPSPTSSSSNHPPLSLLLCPRC